MAADFQDIGGRRFYWDGRSYGSPEEAREAAQGYEAEGFQVKVVDSDEGALVYNRREAQAT
jgi:hypothetical protein